jgi:Tat protein translocase TatB subunit
MNIGPAEILVILFVALLVFGPHRLPEVARQVGGAMRQLRQIQDTVRGELDSVLNPDTTPSFEQNPDTTPSFEQTEPPAVPDPDPFPEPGDHTAIATQTGSREIVGPDDPSSPTDANGPSADADSRFAGPTGSFS